MSAAAVEAAPPKKGLPKKLLMILVSIVVVLAIGGGGALYMMKKASDARAAEYDEGETEGDEAESAEPAHGKTPPTFVALEPFTVNLADRDAERFVQVGITLELRDPKYSAELTAYLPAVRNALLMVLAHKTSEELLERSGKVKLADEIGRETARAMGYRVADPSPPAAPADAEAHDDAPRPQKSRRKREEGPVSHVLFSSFIIQ